MKEKSVGGPQEPLASRERAALSATHSTPTMLIALLCFLLSASHPHEQPAPMADKRSGSAAGSRLRAQLGVGGAGGQTREKALLMSSLAK